MSKKIATEAEVAENSAETRKFVQLRIPLELAEELEAAAARANRKLPSEILFRLRQGQSAPAESLVYGWIDADRNKALGEALGMLAGRLEVAGPMTDDRVLDRAVVLEMLKIAMPEVLDRIGADANAISDDERNFAKLEARKFCHDLWRHERGPHSIGPRPDLEIFKRVAGGEPMASRKGGGHG